MLHHFDLIWFPTTSYTLSLSLTQDLPFYAVDNTKYCSSNSTLRISHRRKPTPNICGTLHEAVHFP